MRKRLTGKMLDQLSEHVKQINFIHRGEGPPVILVHGIAASLSDWDYLVPALVGKGFQTLALDLLGHGDSLKPEENSHYHSDSLYLHLVAWIRNLNLSQPPILVGHSLGGFLCMKYALEQAEAIQKLVLIDPFYSLKQLSPVVRMVNRHPEWGENALRRAPDWLINAVIGWDFDSARNFSVRKRLQVAEDYKRASPKILHTVNTVGDLSTELSRVRCPTLVLWGERDHTLKPESFPRLVEELPCAIGHSISSCGHQPHIGKPEIVNQIVLDFLLRNGTDPSRGCVDGEIPAR
jgi:pimeloyl-ACP methyl ester carboxylesterase